MQQLHTKQEDGPADPGGGACHSSVVADLPAHPGALCLVGGLCDMAAGGGRRSRTSVTTTGQPAGRLDGLNAVFDHCNDCCSVKMVLSVTSLLT